jgi:DNA invertase Pin-like site-specific DNA recombinase
VHDPTDPVGRLPFNVLAVVAETEAELIRARTRDGMNVAKPRGRLRGKGHDGQHRDGSGSRRPPRAMWPANEECEATRNPSATLRLAMIHRCRR